MQNKIERLIKNWKGKLTWDLLTKAIELELGLGTTRQTLCSYTSIATAFRNKKAELRGATPEFHAKMTASDVELVKRNESLTNEIELLKQKNHEQLRMIERMLANASDIPNIDLNELIKRRPEENR